MISAYEHDDDRSCGPECPSPSDTESTLISEAQLILAEKRTSLASLRTGIAIVALPLSILGLLVATSKHYDPAEVPFFLIPLLVICTGMTVTGLYLIGHALIRTRQQDRMLHKIKQMHPRLSELIREG